MKEITGNVRKTRITTGRHGAVKRGRIHRFSKWAEEKYGIPWRSMYEKLRKNRVKIWESVGITRCMDEYGFHGTPGELWERCVRNPFCEFMEKKQMSRMTVWKRFGADDFTELEMNGLNATYRKWRDETDLKDK